MKYFNFERLINKYSAEFVVTIPPKGTYELGEYKQGEPQKVTMSGAIISFSENKIFSSEGTITEQDKALYMTQRIDESLQGAKVAYGGREYRIGNELENFEFTGVYAYTLKFVSKFDGNGGAAL